MISTACIAVGAIICLLLWHQQQAMQSRIGAQGLGLVRLLAHSPYTQLAPESRQSGLLEIVKSSQGNESFAYIVVTNTQNQVVADVSADGVVAPVQPISSLPSQWVGERQVQGSSQSGTFREFYAPVITKGDLSGHVRIGYSQVGLLQWGTDFTIYAMLALPVFLLVYIFYWLLKRELRPIAAISSRVESLAATPALQKVELSIPPEANDFVGKFNSVVDVLMKRTAELEIQNRTALTSSKVVSFQRSRLESILMSLPYGIVVLDEAGTIGFANHQCRTFMGIESDDIHGRKPVEVCNRHEVLDFFNRHSGKDFNHSGSMQFTLGGSVETHVEANAYPLFSDRNQGQISGTLVMFRDVTADHLAKKSRNDFIAHVGHELKTPLHIMTMYSEMLSDANDGTDELQLEVTNVFNDQIERINTLVSNLLNVCKLEMGGISLDRQKVKIDDLINDTYNNFESSANDAGVTIAVDCNVDLSPIHIDKELFRIALNNLVSNAIKYSDAGGSVNIEVNDQREAIFIKVRDSGIGISSEDQHRIFDKFFRADNDETRNREGHGLGLGLSKDIVEAHQGNLTVTSRPGEGSEFSIELKKTPILLREAA